METNRAAVGSERHKPSDAFTVDFDDDEQVLSALRRAVAHALQTHRDQGQYVVARKDGVLVRIEPQDIVVPEVTD